MSPDLPADAGISATALHLLLATHPELVDLPFAWPIDLDAVIRPFITVDHPRGEESLRRLAAALELEVEVFQYGTAEDPKASLRADGRWGGAAWQCIAYVHAPVSGAVVSS